MSLQEFALDVAGTNRVQVSREADTSGEHLNILFNRSMLGSIPQEELTTGHEFLLKDGSTLKVQLANNQVLVLRNGQPLREVVATTSMQQDSRPLISNQSMHVLTHPSVTTFAEEMRNAEWGKVWGKLFTIIFLGTGLAFLSLCAASLQLRSQLGPYEGINPVGVLFLVVFLAVLLVLIVPLLFFAIEGLWYLLAHAFGGRGTFLAQCYTTLLFTLPIVTIDLLSFFVLSWIPFGILLWSLINLILVVYAIVLRVFATIAVHRQPRAGQQQLYLS